MDPVLLYDGNCGFCSRIVRFVLAHERAQTLQFSPRSSRFSDQLLAQAHHLREVDSVIWVDRDDSGRPTRFLVRSAASLRLLRYLGGMWRLLLIAWIVPRPIRDWLYDGIARNRHRIMGNHGCFVPSETELPRFLPEPGTQTVDGSG